MPIQAWTGPWIPTGAADGTAVTAAALTEGTPAAPKAVPWSIFQDGTAVWLHAQGEITCTSTTPTCAVGFYFGTPGSIGTATPIAVSGAQAVSATAAAAPWFLDWYGDVRSLGASGQLYGMGALTWGGNSGTGLTQDMPQVPAPVTAAARLVTVNMFTAAYLLVGVTLSSTTGAPSVTVRHAFGHQSA